METLIDNIITEVKHREDEAFNHMSKHELTAVVSLIEEMEEKATFNDIALLLMKYMGSNHHPHCTAIITSTHAELLEGIECTGETMDYVPD